MKDMQAHKINICYSSPLFALHYLGIAGDLTESSWPSILHHEELL